MNFDGLNVEWEKVSEAKEYIEKHKLEQFFLNITALLVFRQPRDPFAYIQRQIKKLTKHSLIEAEDLGILFDNLDTGRTGCLTKEQSLKNLGVGPSSLDTSSSCVPKSSFIVDWSGLRFL
ncbi:hypothetical protein HELRODRAFT_183321 [Helobdella robusta]|uniref:EF-hand domain-containing protein n=1 Tax=Helobdella robusta TaxID=6412 RepID=T1FJG3_HELRO|nr:hypothetical protein HELRODRAFT_183321 [Helobdella robusta]ESO11309.1 hypothetical protein HELRODRAFT_183321 [Helobdella robusta]